MAAPTIQPEYEALGIHPDTMTCVAILSKQDAKSYVWALATQAIPAVATLDADGKRVHVAVKGGLAYNPGAYFASIVGERPKRCLSTQTGQHPMQRENDDPA